MKSKQAEIKELLDKINLLFRIFEKEGVEKVSYLEKALLKEQAQNLLKVIEEIDAKVPTYEPAVTEKPQPVEFVKEPVKEVVIEQPKPVTPEPVAPKPVVEVVAPPKQQEESLSVNERIAQQQEAKEEQRIVKPLPDNVRNMREIIDLNKSFIFKKELFNNDHASYTMFINKLNTTATEKEAFDLVDAYAAELGWDDEDKTYELIRRAAEKRFLPLL